MTSPAAASTDNFGDRVYRIPRRDTGELIERPSITRVTKMKAAPPLETWKLKMVANGLAQRPDLVALALTDPYQASKQALDAGRHAANMGTALHSLSEHVDDGLDPATLPDVVRSPMELYAAAMTAAGFEAVETEVTVGHDSVLYAGTADRFAYFRHLDLDGLVVADIKTGKKVYPDVALQLAALANAEWIYEASTQTFRDMPPVRRDIAVIVHLTDTFAKVKPVRLDGAFEVFTGLCRAWWLEREKGVIGKALKPKTSGAEPAAPDAAGAVETPASSPAPADPFAAVSAASIDDLKAKAHDTVVRLNAAKARVATIVAVEAAGAELARRWPEGVPTFRQGGLTDANLDTIEAVLVSVERNNGIEFPGFGEPPPPVEPTPPPVEPTPPPVDRRPDRVPGDDPGVVALYERVNNLPTDLQLEVANRAKDANVPNLNSGRATTVDLAIVADLLDSAEERHTERATTFMGLIDMVAVPVPTDLLYDAVDLDGLPGAEHVDRLSDLVDAFGAGVLTSDGGAITVASTVAADLELLFGGKREVTAEAKRQATRLGLPAPMSFDAVLSSPVLVAAVAMSGAGALSA